MNPGVTFLLSNLKTCSKKVHSMKVNEEYQQIIKLCNILHKRAKYEKTNKCDTWIRPTLQPKAILWRGLLVYHGNCQIGYFSDIFLRSAHSVMITLYTTIFLNFSNELKLMNVSLLKRNAYKSSIIYNFAQIYSMIYLFHNLSSILRSICLFPFNSQFRLFKVLDCVLILHLSKKLITALLALIN